jgi:hypothetical protein
LKFNSGRNKGQMEVRECLLSFGAESFSSSLVSKNLKIKIYTTIILPVFYGCETWSLVLREKCRLKVFENRVLRRTFKPNRDEVTGEWRKLHNEELNDLYSSPTIVGVIKSRRMKWIGHVANMREGFWWENLRKRENW